MPGVATEFENLDNQNFRSSSLTASFPSVNNLAVTVAADSALQIITITMQNGNGDVIARLFETLETALPPQLGYSKGQLAAKSRRLNKALERGVEVRRLLEATKSQRDRASKAADEAETALAASKKAADDTGGAKTAAEGLVDELQDASTQAEELVAAIEKRSTASGTLRDEVQEVRDESKAMQASVKTFFDEVEQHRGKLAEAAKALDANTARADSIVSESEELKEQLNDLLQKAVGAGLFGSFERRQRQINLTKWAWTVLTFLAIGAQVLAIIWLASEVPVDDVGRVLIQPSFLIKVSITLPILFAIGFCVRQYGRERDFEEAYAFKSALSFSLKPYIDLIDELSERAEDKAFATFAVETVRQVFESPHEKVARARVRSSKEGHLLNELLDKVIKLVEKGR